MYLERFIGVSSSSRRFVHSARLRERIALVSYGAPQQGDGAVPKRLVTRRTLPKRLSQSGGIVHVQGCDSLKNFKVLASAVVLLTSLAFAPIHRAAAPLRILWIGNSYTYVNELPKIISMLADSSHLDRPPAITGILKGGETLKGHWANPALQKAFEEKWDIVVAQEQSTTPIDAPDSMFKYGKLIAHAAHKSGARVVLDVSWPQKTRPAAEDTIVAAYRRLGDATHASLALAGRAWLDVIAQDPSVELYQKDGTIRCRRGRTSRRASSMKCCSENRPLVCRRSA